MTNDDLKSWIALGRDAAAAAMKASAVSVGEQAKKGLAETRRIAEAAAGTVHETTIKASEHVQRAFGEACDDPRKAVGKVGDASVKSIYCVVWRVTQAWEQRDQVPVIAGAIFDGAKDAIGAANGHWLGRASEREVREELLRTQAELYRARRLDSKETHARALDDRDLLLESTFLGGASLASYIKEGHIPPEIERAYHFAYPNLAADHPLSDQLRHMDAHQLMGLTSGIKGKLFELEYLKYLNSGHLPFGYKAVLAESATQPGWDIKVEGADGHIAHLIQLKATDSTAYVKHALEIYPHIDVTTTSEVQSHLLMQGMSEHVSSSGITNAELDAAVNGAFDHAAVHLHWGPPMIALAFGAWSSFRRADLELYEKSRQFGERGTHSWLAYLAGGAVAVATQTWWMSILGSVGSRLILGGGRAKLTELERLDGIIAQNKAVLAKMAV